MIYFKTHLRYFIISYSDLGNHVQCEAHRASVLENMRLRTILVNIKYKEIFLEFVTSKLIIKFNYLDLELFLMIRLII